MNFSRKTLAGGVRLITIPRPENLSVNVLVLAQTGSEFETKAENGLSHFLEHMCFKGTASRPSSLILSSELDAMGAQYNAFTSQECTGYHISCLPEKLDQAFDILSDMYSGSRLAEEDITRERGVILEEINLSEDLPNRKVHRLFAELLYGDTPAGRSVLGTKETLEKMTQKDFLSYRERHYAGVNTIVVVAGNVDVNQATTLVEKYFKRLPAGDRGRKETIQDSQTAPRVKLLNKKLDQSHLVLGFRTFGSGHKYLYSAQVMAAILGGGMSSRLFQKIREEMGVAYYVWAHHQYYTDHGSFMFGAGVKNGQVEPVVAEILIECQRLKDELVPAEELTRAKDGLIGNLFLDLETPAEIGFFFGSQEVLNQKLETPEEVSDQIKSVSALDLQNFAKDFFVDGKLNLAIVGPYESEKGFVDRLHL